MAARTAFISFFTLHSSFKIILHLELEVHLVERVVEVAWLVILLCATFLIAWAALWTWATLRTLSAWTALRTLTAWTTLRTLLLVGRLLD